VVGHLSARDSIKGTLREGSFTGKLKDEVLREMQNALYTGLPLHRGPVGEPGGGLFAGGTIERKQKYICVSFLDPEAIKILSLGAIWNFSKGTGLS